MIEVNANFAVIFGAQLNYGELGGLFDFFFCFNNFREIVAFLNFM
ncbi:MAG: hypothetical protein ACFFB5_20650 [Promethearchaeota archaeon]